MATSRSKEKSFAQVEFAFRLYKQLNTEEPDENLIFSPLSIYVALSMVQLGAKENTNKQLQSLLGISSVSPEEFHKWLKKVLHNLKQNSKNIEMHLAEKICFLNNIPIIDEFQCALLNIYSVQLNHYDFTTNKFEICNEINEWMKEQTCGKITKLLTPDVIRSNTVFIMLTAIYMKADWKNPFSSFNTNPHPFYSDNQTFEVEMMEKCDDFMYIQDPLLKCQMLRLPYKNNTFGMYFIIPENLSEFEKELTGANLIRSVNSLSQSFVRVKIPKFDVDATYSLEKTLSTLGVNEMFSLENADLSGISPFNPIENVRMTTFIHKCTLQVTEVGTEASAISIGSARGGGPGDGIIQFIADRPFLYFIRDSSSGIILFLGKFCKPKISRTAKKRKLQN